MDDTLFSFMYDHFTSALEAGLPSPSTYELEPKGSVSDISYKSPASLEDLELVDGPLHKAHLQAALAFSPSSYSDLNEIFTDAVIDSRIRSEYGEFFATCGQLEPTYGPNSEPLSHLGSSSSSMYSSGILDRCMDDSTKGSHHLLIDQWNSLPLNASDMPWNTNTTIQHGQLTPGNSPVLIGTPVNIENPRIGENPPCDLAVDGVQMSDAPPVKLAKKSRRTRKSHKKTRTEDEEAKHHEQFLKRNREAAHKCRVKKKSQIENIQERAKEQASEVSAKRLQISILTHEIDTLRALLQPHYQECGDQDLVAHIDSGKSRYEAWSKDMLSAEFTAFLTASDTAFEGSVDDVGQDDMSSRSESKSLKIV